jgi:Leucine-rich repeat (LRR) protein
MNQIGAVNDGLVGCANLRELSLNNNRLTVLNGLSRCTGLQKLSLYRNAIERIDGLQHLRRLHSLDLGRNQIRRAELSSLPLRIFATPEGGLLRKAA